jgi:hypothetical protein
MILVLAISSKAAPAAPDCSPSAQKAAVERMDRLEKEKKYREAYQLFARNNCPPEGRTLDEKKSLEIVMGAMTGRAHRAGGDLECLEIIDDFLSDYAKLDPQSDLMQQVLLALEDKFKAKASGKVSTTALFVRRTLSMCYAGCARHPGPLCAAADKAARRKNEH